MDKPYMTTPSTPQTPPDLPKPMALLDTGGGWMAPTQGFTADQMRAHALAARDAQPQAIPVPPTVKEIVSLMMPWMVACVRFNKTPRGQIDVSEAEAEVQAAFKPLEAALTALVEERDRLRFELDGVNAMREVAARQANAVPAIPEEVKK